MTIQNTKTFTIYSEFGCAAPRERHGTPGPGAALGIRALILDLLPLTQIDLPGAVPTGRRAEMVLLHEIQQRARRPVALSQPQFVFEF